MSLVMLACLLVGWASLVGNLLLEPFWLVPFLNQRPDNGGLAAARVGADARLKYGELYHNVAVRLLAIVTNSLKAFPACSASFQNFAAFLPVTQCLHIEDWLFDVPQKIRSGCYPFYWHPFE